MRIIQAYLPPEGISQLSIKQDLASLKASENYAKIIARVRDRIAAEEERARQEAEAARRAAEAAARKAEEARLAAAAAEAREKAAAEESRRCAEEAAQEAEAEARQQEEEADQLAAAEAQSEKVAETAAEKEVTFDFEGVARHLKVADHLQVFRELVTSPSIKPYVPVDQQAALAEALVEAAAVEKKEHPQRQGLTSGFIRENLLAHAGILTRQQRQLSKKEAAGLKQEEWSQTYEHLEERFYHFLRSAVGPGEKLILHLKKSPPGIMIHYPPRTRGMVERIKHVIQELEKLE